MPVSKMLLPAAEENYKDLYYCASDAKTCAEVEILDGNRPDTNTPGIDTSSTLSSSPL